MSWQYLSGQFAMNSWALVVLVIWTLFWKGWALWKSARRGEKYWFIALLIVNLLGLLEMLYIFVFIPWMDSKKKKEVSHE
jgi:hypothetical protein